MNVIVTGSSGLVGSAVVRACLDRGDNVIGLDNDMRAYFFGDAASTSGMTHRLMEYATRSTGKFTSLPVDVSDGDSVFWAVDRFGDTLDLMVHCAAQPSHDWAAQNPELDFRVNALGTLNVLESVRQLAPLAVVIHVSTNKVYGDRPNMMGYMEKKYRIEASEMADFYNGFTEDMSIDHCTHSVFGASKLAADIYAQEYGRYFGMKVGIFRGGCLTGSAHAGAEKHGFLSYLVKTAVQNKPYTIFGYEGKQVRDNIHAEDLARAFLAYADDPDPAAVYNIGGGRANAISVLEALEEVARRGYRHSEVKYGPERIGDHKWWITDTSKFEKRYPEWKREWSLADILDDMVEMEGREI